MNSVEKVLQHLAACGLQDRLKTLDESSATVELAAAALGCKPELIAKTLSFDVNGKAVLIVAAGDAKVNNAKFKMKIVPGMRMDIVAELKSYRRGLAIGKSVGYVDGTEACSVELVVAIPDVLNQFKPKV